MGFFALQIGRLRFPTKCAFTVLAGITNKDGSLAGVRMGFLRFSNLRVTALREVGEAYHIIRALLATKVCASNSPARLSMPFVANVTKCSWNEHFRKLTTADSTGLIMVWVYMSGRWFEEMINNRGKTSVADLKWTSDGKSICIAYEDGPVSLTIRHPSSLTQVPSSWALSTGSASGASIFHIACAVYAGRPTTRSFSWSHRMERCMPTTINPTT